MSSVRRMRRLGEAPTRPHDGEPAYRERVGRAAGARAGLEVPGCAHLGQLVERQHEEDIESSRVIVSKNVEWKLLLEVTFYD